MKNVEAKLDKKTKGLFNRRPTTVAAATASLQQNIDDLKYVTETRAADAERKAKQIEKLTQQKADDEKEATRAGKLAKKLEDFFFGDED